MGPILFRWFCLFFIVSLISFFIVSRMSGLVFVMPEFIASMELMEYVSITVVMRCGCFRFHSSAFIIAIISAENTVNFGFSLNSSLICSSGITKAHAVLESFFATICVYFRMITIFYVWCTLLLVYHNLRDQYACLLLLLLCKLNRLFHFRDSDLLLYVSVF